MDKEKIYQGRVERFLKWKNWVISHGYTPSTHSPDIEERNLGIMISQWKSTVKGLKELELFYEEYMEIKEKYPTSPNVRKKRSNEENMKEIRAWALANMRLPNKRATDQVEFRLSCRLASMLETLKIHPYKNRKYLLEFEEFKAYLRDMRKSKKLGSSY